MKERLNMDRYIRECNRFQWRVLAIGAATVLFMFSSMAVMKSLHDQAKPMLSSWFGDSSADIVIGLCPVPGVVVLLVGLFWLQRKSNKTPELNCPGCKKFIGGMRYLVVATKCCPNCGKQILDDVD